MVTLCLILAVVVMILAVAGMCLYAFDEGNGLINRMVAFHYAGKGIEFVGVLIVGIIEGLTSNN